MTYHTGWIGFFETPESLLKGAEAVRKSGFKDFDVFSPFPVHGMDEAQGLTRSWIPFVTFAAGLTGALCGFLFQYITSVEAWPLIVGGKPFNSWPAFIPITFELTILFAGFATATALFLANGLPNYTKKALDPRLTCDRFAIWIVEAKEEKNKPTAKEVLENNGALDVQCITEKGWF